MWRRGVWWALLAAVGFAVLVNLLILSTFLWSDALRPSVRSGGWAMAFLVWVGAAIASRIEENRGTERELQVHVGDPLPRAIDAYLKGQWFEAECLLVDLLDRHPRDIESRLMLATLYRHTRRYEEARGALDCLECHEGAGKWVVEIARERRLLNETAGKAAESAPAPQCGEEPARSGRVAVADRAA
jgi:hypothetical protein